MTGYVTSPSNLIEDITYYANPMLKNFCLRGLHISSSINRVNRDHFDYNWHFRDYNSNNKNNRYQVTDIRPIREFLAGAVSNVYLWYRGIRL